MKKIQLIINILFIYSCTYAHAATFTIHNLKTNSSTANSTQAQAQHQGQDQKNLNVLNDVGNSTVAFKDSFNGSKPIRYLPIASDIVYSGLQPSMFSQPKKDNGGNFISAKNLVKYIGKWNVSKIYDNDINEDDINIDLTIIDNASNSAEDVNIINFMLDGSEVVKMLKTKGSLHTLALGTIDCDDNDINSAELFMVLAKKAKSIGASKIVLLSEGVKVKLKSSGQGIGLSYNYAGVNSTATGQGQVGAGGTGYSTGTANYNKLPYLSFILAE